MSPVFSLSLLFCLNQFLFLSTYAPPPGAQSVYLRPTHQSLGITTSALHTLLHSWFIPHMNAHTIHACAFEHNLGSKRVFEKNGFRVFDFVPGCTEVAESKISGGGRVGQWFFEWRRAPG